MPEPQGPPSDPGPPPWSPADPGIGREGESSPIRSSGLPWEPAETGYSRGEQDSPVESNLPPIDLNRATFVELREQGLSVSQATRVLAYRERLNGYRSPDDLAQVPGISAEDMERLRGRFTT